jgi:hypothetical protein
MNVSLSRAAAVCLVLCVQVIDGQAHPTAQLPDPKNLTPVELKRVYLACETAATAARMSGPDAMHCSMVAETLRQQVFDGDIEKLLAWWRTHRPDASGR